jgi:hypothetical protein
LPPRLSNSKAGCKDDQAENKKRLDPPFPLPACKTEKMNEKMVNTGVRG